MTCPCPALEASCLFSLHSETKVCVISGHCEVQQTVNVFTVCGQAPGYGDIRLTVESVPDTVTLETTFNVVCRITNCW